MISAGRGFWAPGNLSMYGNPLPFGPNNASAPAVRFLLVVERDTTLVLRSGTGHLSMYGILGNSPSVQGRAGPILDDNPWTGCTIDMRLRAEAGWEVPRPAEAGAYPTGVLTPQPGYAETGAGAAATSVSEMAPLRDGTRRFLFHFARNLVGHAALRPGAVTGEGSVTVEHCELWNSTAQACVKFARDPPETTTCSLNVRHHRPGGASLRSDAFSIHLLRCPSRPS